MLIQATSVAIHGRALLIMGPPGTGKSTLALGLIDRGASLIGDDGTLLLLNDGKLLASSPPAIRGLLEVRNLGLISYPVTDHVPVALVAVLDRNAPRFIDKAGDCALLGLSIPQIGLWPDTPHLPVKAELALETYGLR